MTVSWLREGPNPDGTPGPLSFRRIVAALFAPSALLLFALGLGSLASLAPGVPAWVVVLPGALCLVAVLILAICTTVGDIVAIVQAARGAK